MVGGDSGPATAVDASPIFECLCKKLENVFHSPQKKDGKTISRWNDRQKNLEKRILTRKVPLSPPKTGSTPLPPARPLLPKAITTPPPPHTFPILAGQPLPQLPPPIQLST
ncbi:Hypothetical predicted protein [Paramuricea clavata]|uniref:Uncharacterized protein n=1 Tax=Paramuricea clavata TaxID=317549 RepID=A0A7D9I0H2_PARCT|nr:Hypothetical predicted protein [Paramuricea clavata]